MKWSEVSSILFTLSQIKLLNSSEEWQEIVKIFLERARTDYDQERVVKGLTSLSVASVQAKDDFWFDVFELVEDRLEAERLDPFLKMNLLWSMARNLTSLQPAVLISLLNKVVPSLTADLNQLLR
jgi:hypothetical protein